MSWENQPDQYGSASQAPQPFGGTPDGNAPAAYPPGYAVPYLYPPVSGFGMTPALFALPPRPIWKTFVVSLLLVFIPFVGTGMSIVYIYTRNRPHEYNAGEAAIAGLLLFVFFLIAAVALLGLFGALGGLNR